MIINAIQSCIKINQNKQRRDKTVANLNPHTKSSTLLEVKLAPSCSFCFISIDNNCSCKGPGKLLSINKLYLYIFNYLCV